MTPEKRLVYVLESVSCPARHYTGLSSNVAERLLYHNDGHCFHTAKYRPWRVLVVIEFADGSHAAQFEKYLKSGSGRAFAKRHFS